ncbi:MAG: aminopeptidase P family protein [Actinomycetes bacterium]
MSRSDLANLPGLEVGERADRVRAGFAGAHVDALVVTRLVNVRYLTGFTGSAGVVVVTPDAMTLVTDGRYTEQAGLQIAEAGADATVVIGATAEEQTGAQRVALGGHARVGLEAPSVSWAQQRGYARSFPDCELIATDGLVEDVRRRKEPAEVARIRAACAIADEALAELLPTLADAPTEREFALALEFGMRRRGASAVSFDPIVAAGPNGSRPHARPSDRRIGRHELIVIDFGCIVDGYCSDMTRTVSVGEPSADAVHVWETVLAAQRAGRDVVRPGTDLAAVDLAARSVIDAAGFGASFAHGTGHGVGLEIHESPRVARTSSGTLASGDVVTVEPGVYLPGVGGVRIEDTLVVTEDAADALTEFPKQLVV